MTSLSTSFTESTYILTQTTPNRTLCLPPIPPRFLYIAGKSLQLRLRSRPHAITRTKTAPPELLSSLPGLSGAHEGKQWPGVLAVAGFRRRRWVLGLESLRENQAQSSAVCDELFTRPLRSAPSLFTHLFSSVVLLRQHISRRCQASMSGADAHRGSSSLTVREQCIHLVEHGVSCPVSQTLRPFFFLFSLQCSGSVGF